MRPAHIARHNGLHFTAVATRRESSPGFTSQWRTKDFMSSPTFRFRRLWIPEEAGGFAFDDRLRNCRELSVSITAKVSTASSVLSAPGSANNVASSLRHIAIPPPTSKSQAGIALQASFLSDYRLPLPSFLYWLCNRTASAHQDPIGASCAPEARQKRAIS
jgi:hypothetical protein